MIVSITVVVMLADDVPPGGGGGGDTTPGESICPPKAETAIASVRIVAPHVRRRVFIVGPPTSDEKEFA